MTLKEYIDFSGIVSCNVNPYMPSLSDVGASWGDAVALIDSHELFYTKLWRGRTAYLSPEAYSLITQLFTVKPMPESAAALYSIIESYGEIDARELKRLSMMPDKEYQKTFDHLLRNLYITAIRNGRYINETWSTFMYSTSRYWESVSEQFSYSPDALGALRKLFARTLPPAELDRLIAHILKQ